MRDPLALIPLPTPSVRFGAYPDARQRVALCGLGATVLLAMGFLTAGLPVISMCMLALAGVSSFVFGSATELAGEARDRQVVPEDIAASDVRAQYQAILLGLAEVERALGDAPRLRTSLAPVVERCRTAVKLAGRLALLANPIQHYLDDHDAGFVRAAVDRLHARAAATRDDVALGALHQAAATRARQLATLDQIAARRDRICARLELVHAALEAFAVTILKLHTLEEEQIVLAGESVTEHLDGIQDDLDVLEAALEPELAA
jgi:hypothetical protein